MTHLCVEIVVMNMHGTRLYSVLLELQAQDEAYLPATMGHQIHAMFLQLVARANPALSVRLHDEPGYRPFTLSPLLDAASCGNSVALSPGQIYHVRVTLLDGGNLWDYLSTLLLETGPLKIRLGGASFTITRLLSTSAADTTGWAERTSWEELVATPMCQSITLSFASPTAFNISGKFFALFPEPPLVWESLVRSCNSYAPDPLKIEKQALQDMLWQKVIVTRCSLSTHTLHYPKYTQKGFAGKCTYALQEDGACAAQLARLAAFARFAGVGYKTTMGMGQVRTEETDERE